MLVVSIYPSAVNTKHPRITRMVTGESIANPAGAYEADGLNRYAKVNGQPLGYDASSNLTNDGKTIFTYDDENRLLTANLTASIVYDPNICLDTKRKYLHGGNALITN